MGQEWLNHGHNVLRSGVSTWDNSRAAESANEAARPRRKTGPDLPINQLRK